MSRLEQSVHFGLSHDPLHPWEAWVEGEHWQVSVTAMPDGTRRYSLLVDGHKEEDFTEWPAAWSIAEQDLAWARAQIEIHEAELEQEIRRMEAGKRQKPIDLCDDEDEDDD